MFVDISFELNCCHDEFIYDKVLQVLEIGRFISPHTEKGQQFLKSQGIDLNLHERTYVNNLKYKEIYKNFKENSTLSGTIDSFYWKNREHTEHV